MDKLMLNSTNTNIVSNHINAVSGGISKTYIKSFFIRCDLNSSEAKELFSPKPRYYYKRSESSWGEFHAVVVIQMILAGDMQVMAEIMFKDDYEEMMKGL